MCEIVKWGERNNIICEACHNPQRRTQQWFMVYYTSGLSSKHEVEHIYYPLQTRSCYLLATARKIAEAKNMTTLLNFALIHKLNWCTWGAYAPKGRFDGWVMSRANSMQEECLGMQRTKCANNHALQHVIRLVEIYSRAHVVAASSKKGQVLLSNCVGCIHVYIY